MNTWQLRSIPAAFVLCLLASSASAQESKPAEKHFEVFLQVPGAKEPVKVGTSVEREEARGDKVAHVTVTKFAVGRGPAAQKTEQVSEFLESKDGKLLEFSVRQSINGQGKLIRGKLTDDKVELTVGEGEDARKRTLDRPKGALTPRQFDKKIVEAGLAAGKKMKFSVYPLPDEPENAHDIEVEVVSAEKIEFDGRPIDGFKVKLAIDLFGNTVTMHQWVDAKGDSYRMEMQNGAITFIMKRVK